MFISIYDNPVRRWWQFSIPFGICSWRGRRRSTAPLFKARPKATKICSLGYNQIILIAMQRRIRDVLAGIIGLFIGLSEDERMPILGIPSPMLRMSRLKGRD